MRLRQPLLSTIISRLNSLAHYSSSARANVCWRHHLCFPLVSDQQVVGREVTVHHVVSVHELHSCSSLAGQLQPQRPGAVQPETWRSLYTTVTGVTTELQIVNTGYSHKICGH